MMRRVGIVVWLCLALFAPAAFAHELRPAYLELRELSDNTIAVTWKVPARGEMRLGLFLDMAPGCSQEAEPIRSIEAGAYLERWTAVSPDGLKGATIGVKGLRATLADHLLFVFALLLLISNRWALLKTITGFTIAHSITLTGAALGYVSLPQKPVEAIIALSIAFVASELIKMPAGQKRLSEQQPWLIAFVFGLLHGFGFAGALKEIGLPQVDVPLALLTFNLGVEAGQLLFVAAVVVIWKVITAAVAVPLQPSRVGAAYLIGAVSMAWLFERLAIFIGCESIGLDGCLDFR